MAMTLRISAVFLGLCVAIAGDDVMHWSFAGHPEDDNVSHAAESQPKIFQGMIAQDPDAIAKISDGNDGLADKIVYWNNKPWEKTLVEYLDEGSKYFIHKMIFHGEKAFSVRKDLFQVCEANRDLDQKIETWHYFFDKDKENTLRQIDVYRPNSSLVEQRRLFDEKEHLETVALFDYDESADMDTLDKTECLPSVNRMMVANKEGVVTQDYKEVKAIDLKALYGESNLPEKEIQRRLSLSEDTTRTPLLIFDSGIDISHLELAHKIWRNPAEVLNGIDDDENGIVDDIFGVSDNPRLGQLVPDLRLPRYGLPTVSHGTLVASVATQGRDDVAIMAVSEITYPNSDEIFQRAEAFIKAHRVRYTNMSFTFDREFLDYEGRATRLNRIKQLIDNTPETLHLVSAGNGTHIAGNGFNVDTIRLKGGLIPVMLGNHNTLVVGALETSELRYADYPTYDLAAFSNVGETSVDILAPGYQVCGARMGGGTMCADGTSFAAPYVWNHGVMNVAGANPNLNILEIKEILLKTAYIPDPKNPFPVRSGGILHPRRAAAVGRFLNDNPHTSIEEAVLAVRQKETHPLKGERCDAAYLAALQQFWAAREMGSAAQWMAEIKNHKHLAMREETTLRP